REESAECECECEELPQQGAELSILERVDQRCPSGGAALEFGVRMGNNRGQQEIGADDARERQRCGGEDRICIVELSQVSGKSGAQQKAYAERDADNAERLGAVFRLGDVGNVCLCDSQIASSQAIDDACEEDDP